MQLPAWLTNKEKWIISELKLEFLGNYQDLFNGYIEEWLEDESGVQIEDWILIPGHVHDDEDDSYGYLSEATTDIYLQGLLFTVALGMDEAVRAFEEILDVYELKRMLPYEQLALSL